MTWIEIFNFGTGVLSVLGLAITLWQVRRTAAVVEATRQAVTTTIQKLSINQLLLLAPQLQQIENDLDLAVHADDPIRALASINAWRRGATEVLAFLRRTPGTNSSEAEASIRDSLSLALAAKNGLLEHAKPVENATRRVRKAIGDGCLNVWLVAQNLAADQEGNHDER